MTFATPLILIGLIAAAIPPLLHLLSSVRAQEVQFPTLRFLRLSMEKTARRRRIQHWLLLAMRSMLLALLCLAAAEPITRATGAFLGGQSSASVIILDNSFSMAARDGADDPNNLAAQSNRFEQARSQAASLLSAENSAQLAALMTTSGGFVSDELTSQHDLLRDELARAKVGNRPAAIAQRLREAIQILDRNKSAGNKSIYLLSDLQRISVEEMRGLTSLAATKDIRLLMVKVGHKDEVDNVGIANMDISGQRVIDSPLVFTVRLVNSAAGRKKATAVLRIDGRDASVAQECELMPAGQEGSIRTLTFRHRFDKSGPVSGEVVIKEADDLPQDNLSRFSFDVSGRVSALVVRGPRKADDTWWNDSAARLLLALQPYDRQDHRWPITPRDIPADSFRGDELDADTNAVFFTDVPAFDAQQAEAIGRFVRAGGTAVFYMGPNVQIDNYNERFSAGSGPLIDKLGAAVGQVGLTERAQQVKWLDIADPLLSGLWPSMSDYLSPSIQVQRYVELAGPADSSMVLARLSNGRPLVLRRNVGSGSVIVCLTSASPQWSDLSNKVVFLPMTYRAALLARSDPYRDNTYLAGSQVVLRLGPAVEGENGEKVAVRVQPPTVDAAIPAAVSVDAAASDEGMTASFLQTDSTGIYKWTGGGRTGQFAINAAGDETMLQTVSPEEAAAILKSAGATHVYAGNSVDEVISLAAADAAGQNWWATLTAVVILLLVCEAVVANRRADM